MRALVSPRSTNRNEIEFKLSTPFGVNWTVRIIYITCKLLTRSHRSIHNILITYWEWTDVFIFYFQRPPYILLKFLSPQLSPLWNSYVIWGRKDISEYNKWLAFIFSRYHCDPGDISCFTGIIWCIWLESLRSRSWVKMDISANETNLDLVSIDSLLLRLNLGG